MLLVLVLSSYSRLGNVSQKWFAEWIFYKLDDVLGISTSPQHWSHCIASCLCLKIVFLGNLGWLVHRVFFSSCSGTIQVSGTSFFTDWMPNIMTQPTTSKHCIHCIRAKWPPCPQPQLIKFHSGFLLNTTTLCWCIIKNYSILDQGIPMYYYYFSDF